MIKLQFESGTPGRCMDVEISPMSENTEAVFVVAKWDGLSVYQGPHFDGCDFNLWKAMAIVLGEMSRDDIAALHDEPMNWVEFHRKASGIAEALGDL